MEAPEEVRARATLNEMQLRISHGPHSALGVAENATLEQVRTAFLALTKQFHPARFGRMATDIQRLANEVFLGIKGAHDALVKALGGGKRAAMQSGGMPVIQSEGSGRTLQPRSTGSIPTVQPRATGQIPVQRPATPPTFARGTDRPASGTTGERPSSPTIPRTTTPMQPARTTTSPIPARTTTPPLGTPVQRPTTQPMRPVTPTGARPASPTGQRPGTPPGAAPRPPSASTGINPDTVRGTVAPREPAFDERAALRESLMLINDGSWAAARATLSTLATKVPQSKNYRALLGYVRGREAQVAGKAEEAALEYQRALELDPGLTMAKQALADVQRRR